MTLKSALKARFCLFCAEMFFFQQFPLDKSGKRPIFALLKTARHAKNEN